MAEDLQQLQIESVLTALEVACRQGDFQSVADFLEAVDPTELYVGTVVAIVTITKYAEQHLPHRSEFVRKASEEQTLTAT